MNDLWSQELLLGTQEYTRFEGDDCSFRWSCATYCHVTWLHIYFPTCPVYCLWVWIEPFFPRKLTQGGSASRLPDTPSRWHTPSLSALSCFLRLWGCIRVRLHGTSRAEFSGWPRLLFACFLRWVFPLFLLCSVYCNMPVSIMFCVWPAITVPEACMFMSLRLEIPLHTVAPGVLQRNIGEALPGIWNPGHAVRCSDVGLRVISGHKCYVLLLRPERTPTPSFAP